MRGPTRRELVRRSVEGALLGVIGCAPAPPDPAAPSCRAPGSPVPGGVYLGEVPLAERTESAGEVHGEGLDGRRTVALEELDTDSLLVPNEDFYVRTAASTLLDLDQDWTLSVTGLVTPTSLRLADLLPLAEDQGDVLVECSGNTRSAAFGLMSAARWGGIRLSRVLELLDVDPAATRIRVGGFDRYPEGSESSTPGCDWIFRLDEIGEAFLAVTMNGEPLPLDHGYPVRLVAPLWYGCCHVKWVDTLELLDDSAPSTDHMREFASRTHQAEEWALARDFTPATMAQAALPVRVEMWRVGERIAYQIIGVMWGGARPTDKLVIGFGGGPKVPVDSCPLPSTTRTWSLWSHVWYPDSTGPFSIDLAVDDPDVPTPRLDSGWYRRTLDVPET